jgi:hypothetical protein
MSYQSQWRLQNDDAFVSRSRAALTNQAVVYKDDARADISSLATSILKGSDPQETLTFISTLAAAPGFADKVDNADGTIDSSKIEDTEILSAVQAEWPMVAALFYPTPPA